MARERRHQETLKGIQSESVRGPAAPPRLSKQSQAPRRKAERSVRKRAVAWVRLARQKGKRLSAAAKSLRLPVTTLHRWWKCWLKEHCPAKPIGRPVRRPAPERRNLVIRTIVREGVNLGVVPLTGLFPEFPRRELADMKRRIGILWRRLIAWSWLEVNWLRPGSVWAVDLARPLAPIGGTMQMIVAIRDLSSHYQLAWEPVANGSAPVTLSVWKAIGDLHGYPLVRKNDNGKTFIPWERELADAAPPQVVLWSPPRTPRYNGAIEAGIRWMKERTETAAAMAGHPGIWTPEDCNWARQQANRLARPWGPGGPTPQEVWENRTPLSEAERGAFTTLWATVYKEQTGCNREGEDRELDREVTRLALERSGLIEYRRRPISLLLKRFFLSNVS